MKYGPLAILLAAVLAPFAARAQTAELTSPTSLRICADPHDLPFSDQSGDGFENKIADLLSRSLKLPIEYTWYPNSQGFVRNTLGKQRCDVVLGTVSGADMMDTTDAYYHTGYMLVTRTADHITARAIGDPALAGRRFGLVAATPPTSLLLRHNLMDQTKSYDLFVDTRYENPPRNMLHDLADGKIDVALLWGPIAGYYIAHDHLPLTATFLDDEGGPVRLDYHIAMGVRPSDTEWRRRLNRVISQHRAEITQILEQYNVPLLDEQNHPLAATPAASTQ